MDNPLIDNSQTEQASALHVHSSTEMLLNPAVMAQVESFAEKMAAGTIMIPKHLQNKPSDCLAVVMQAARWGMDPFAVAQKTHLVNGTLGYEAQLVNAVITSSKAIEGRFHFRYGGDNWSNKGAHKDCWVQCGAVLKGEEEIQWGEPLYTSTVTTKNSPLWSTAPRQQASYLATKYWARLYAPQVILGVYSSDELEPVRPVKERVINPVVNTESEVLKATVAPDVDGALSDVGVALLDAITNSDSPDALRVASVEVQGAIANDQLNDMDKTALQNAWKDKNEQFKA